MAKEIIIQIHLASYRDEKGLTQDELAEKSGVSRRRIIQIEQGEIDVTLLTVAKLAAALDIQFWDLVDVSILPEGTVKQ